MNTRTGDRSVHQIVSIREETMKKALLAVILAIVFGIGLNSFETKTQMGSGMMGSGGTAWGSGSFRLNSK